MLIDGVISIRQTNFILLADVPHICPDSSEMDGEEIPFINEQSRRFCVSHLLMFI